MSKELTISHLASLALMWAASESLPFNAVECWFEYYNEPIHLRFCDDREYRAPRQLPDAWARASDDDLPGGGGSKEIEVEFSILEQSVDFIRETLLPRYLEALKASIPLPNG